MSTPPDRGSRTVASSRLSTVTLTTPDMSNFAGKVHGGHVLRLVDQIAYACASNYSAQYCVTRSVDRVDFRVPVLVGELLILEAQVNYVGRTSMEVGVRASSRNLRHGTTRHTNTCYLTMVALDEETRRPTPVPRLMCETDEDRRRFADGARRRERSHLLREVEETQERYQHVLEVAKVAILLVDGDHGAVQDANAEARALLGYGEADLAQRVVWDLHPEKERSKALALWERVIAEGFAEGVLIHQTHSGLEVPLRVTSWLVPLAGRDLIQRVLRPLK